MRPRCAARTTTLALFLVGLGSLTRASEDVSEHQADYKVQHFVTEPNIKAIPWSIMEHDPQVTAPGYWFVAPLISSRQRLPDNREYTPLQTGAQIYDRNGDLVWSMQDQPMPQVHTFQPVSVYGEQRLTAVVQSKPRYYGLVLDSHFEQIARVSLKDENIMQDFHEFHLNADGKTAILAAKFINRDVNSKIGNSGFQEIELSTGNLTFQWDALSAGINIDEAEQEFNSTPDFLHLNSVDKNSEGEYLISCRHTSTVYKISGKDGSILWRLGGHRSDFILEPGVEFHWQHDARFRYENATHTIISLLDNAASEIQDSKQTPAAGKLILLNHESMTASLLRQFPRPNGLGSRKMGNLQTLGDDPTTSNVLINWASPIGISEFDSEGRHVLEASLAGGGVTSYRIFKSPFVGRPLYPPVLKVLSAVTGPTGQEISASFYMSWNGATEVRSWRIYILEQEEGTSRLVAEIAKQGFETAWVLGGRQSGIAYVEAVDADGKVLGKSNVTSVDGLRGHSSARVEELENESSTKGRSIMQWVLLWLLCAFVPHALYTTVHKLLAVYHRRRGGYKLLQYVSSGK